MGSRARLGCLEMFDKQCDSQMPVVHALEQIECVLNGLRQLDSQQPRHKSLTLIPPPAR